MIVILYNDQHHRHRRYHHQHDIIQLFLVISVFNEKSKNILILCLLIYICLFVAF